MNQQQPQPQPLPPPIPVPATEATILGHQAHQTYVQVEETGPATLPLDFIPPRVLPADRDVNGAIVADPVTREIDQMCTPLGVVVPRHQQQYQQQQHNITIPPHAAYWPIKELQKAIYGSVWYGVVVQPVGQQPESRANNGTPSLWQVVVPTVQVAIKILDRSRIREMLHRYTENPIKEMSAMQYLQHSATPQQQHLFGDNDDDDNNSNSMIGHDNVLTTLVVLQDAMYLYGVMPYCRQGDLHDTTMHYCTLHGDERGMTEPVARHCFRQILQGLHYLQTRGLCHRDLSLENVMLDDGGICKIIDFGMTLPIPHHYHSGQPLQQPSQQQQPPPPPPFGLENNNADPTVTDVTHGSIRRLMLPQGTCGKRRYMSPEIRRNTRNIDGFAVDLWCVGVMLYIMLLGIPPWQHADRTDPCYRIVAVHGRLRRQLELWRYDNVLSPEAIDLLQNMLYESPRRRLTLAQAWHHEWTQQPHLEPPADRHLDG